jgi:hypothetical protein
LSVNQHNYILIGAKVDPKVVTEEIYESEEFEMLNWAGQHKAGELAYLYDAMNSDYFIVGVPLLVDHHCYNGFPVYEHNPNEFAQVMLAHKVKEHVKEKFNQEVEPKLIVMTHFV